MPRTRGVPPLLLACCLSVALIAQKVDREGKAWLDGHSDPPAISVDGAWQAGQWGIITLHQAAGARDVTGKGDDWNILGVVSGSQAFLLFYEGKDIAYSGTIASENPDTLAGQYTEGIPAAKSRLRLLHLTRDGPLPQLTSQPARVIVYRAVKPIHPPLSRREVSPAIFVDDREYAHLNGHKYVTLTLPAGKHRFASSDEQGFAVLDLQPGAAYYLRLLRNTSGRIRVWFSPHQVDADTAFKEMGPLNPAADAQVTLKQLVSIAPFSPANPH